MGRLSEEAGRGLADLGRLAGAVRLASRAGALLFGQRGGDKRAKQGKGQHRMHDCSLLLSTKRQERDLAALGDGDAVGTAFSGEARSGGSRGLQV